MGDGDVFLQIACTLKMAKFSDLSQNFLIVVLA